MDEVGLAEVSKYNPLKVLHGLIEPQFPKEQLDIGVVGISNWALDAAKMNRAIHLSRPEPGMAASWHWCCSVGTSNTMPQRWGCGDGDGISCLVGFVADILINALLF